MTLKQTANLQIYFSTIGNNLIIYDLGLLARHVFASKNMWIFKSDKLGRQAQQISAEVKQTWSTDELEWLEIGYYVELESFGNNLIIYDLGLLPRHVFASKNMWIFKSDELGRQAQQISAEVKQTWSTDELEWLEAGFHVELESFLYRKLLQVASQVIAKTQAVANGYSTDSDGTDEGIIFVNYGEDSRSRSYGFFASDSFS